MPDGQDKHIGIASVSAEGGALCYRQVLREASRRMDPGNHPTVSVHNFPLARYVDAVRRDDWRRVGDLLRQSADGLVQIGAQLVVAPDNATQHGVPLAEVGSTATWLKTTEIVADAVADDGRQNVGILGTRTVTGGSAYQTHLGIKGVKVVAPDPEDAEAMDTIIFGELVYGRITAQNIQRMAAVVDRFREKGCDAVILGCSEAPLVVTPETSSLPVYDAMSLLARRAIDWALDPDA